MSEDGVERQILDEIDRQTGYTVGELADRIGVENRDVQNALESLMDRGLITSTPDWRYRRSRVVSDGGTGLYGKYEVQKDGETVEDCFVLEPESDSAARTALLAYASATDDERLSGDLLDWVRDGASEESDRAWLDTEATVGDAAPGAAAALLHGIGQTLEGAPDGARYDVTVVVDEVEHGEQDTGTDENGGASQ